MALPKPNFVVFVNDPHFTVPMRRPFWNLEKALEYMDECVSRRYPVVELIEL